MNAEWFEWSTSTLLSVGLTAVLMLIWSVVVVRIIGLRSFSKMTSVDFIVTVATGSILATTTATSTSIFTGAAALLSLLAVQAAITWGRVHIGLDSVVDNQPVLLMRAGGEVVDHHMRRHRVTHDDVRAKLREANVTDPSQILAVVLEATGDISVLHGQGPLDEGLLEDVNQG